MLIFLNLDPIPHPLGAPAPRASLGTFGPSIVRRSSSSKFATTPLLLYHTVSYKPGTGL